MRKMGPLDADHPAVYSDDPFVGYCAACREPLEENDFVVLVPVGPGDDSDEREKARNGRTYNSVSVIVHWACATGIEDGEG